MTVENNRYEQKMVDLNAHQSEENQPTKEMIRNLTQAGKWASMISYIALLVFILLIIALLATIVTNPLSALPPSLLLGGIMYATWLIYSITKEYANVARNLDNSVDPADDVLICFKLHARFLKTISIILMIPIVFVIVGFLIVLSWQH